MQRSDDAPDTALGRFVRRRRRTVATIVVAIVVIVVGYLALAVGDKKGSGPHPTTPQNTSTSSEGVSSGR
jgi:uncharacterized membrane protein YdfJ with MMPL/SSD domain